MFEENFMIVIPVDTVLHSTSRPFCDVTLYPDCPCGSLRRKISTRVPNGSCLLAARPRGLLDLLLVSQRTLENDPHQQRH